MTQDAWNTPETRQHSIVTSSVVRDLTSLKRILVVLLLPGWCLRFEPVSAADPMEFGIAGNADFAHVLRRVFDKTDGLPSNWINDLVQTQDGFIWLATDNGLVRYDGSVFHLFSRSNTSELPASEVRVLTEDSDGVLWIGTSYGLSRYIPGRPGRFESVDAISGTTVRAIYEDRSGTIWIGTHRKTYRGTRESGFEPVPSAPIDARTFCETVDGTFWLGARSGLYRQNGQTFEHVTHQRLPAQMANSSGVPKTQVNVIFTDSDGDVWVGANRALLHYSDGKFTERGRALTTQQIYDVTQANNGAIYVAARFGLYRSVQGRPFNQISDEESAFCLLEDKIGDLWVGHGDNRGLVRFRGNPARILFDKSRVHCIYTDPASNDLWIGSDNGLHRLRSGSLTSFDVEDGLPARRVNVIMKGAHNSLWIGTARGAITWDGSRLVPDSTTEPLSEVNVGCALLDSAGRLWLGFASGRGAILADGRLTDLPELGTRRLHWFFEDSDNIVWIGHERGLYRSVDGAIVRCEEDALRPLQNPRYLCHEVDEEGTLWMGTSNGIARFKAGQFDAFPPECGLQADNIERIAADDSGNLWFGGRDGLFRVVMTELDEFADGRRVQVNSFRVEGFDRFPPIRAFSRGCLTHAGNLLVVGEKGIVELPTATIGGSPQVPTLHFSEVLLDGQTIPFNNPFQIQAGRRRLSFTYSIPEFTYPEHVEAKYRLDGYDQDWVNAGSDRRAEYTDLRPGNYSFTVAARVGGNEWREIRAPIVFTVEPRVWETMWFRFLALLTGIMLGVIYFRYRMRHVRRQNEALRREITERHRAEEEARRNMEQLARVSRAASMGEITTSIAHEVKQPLFAIVSNAQTAQKLLALEQPDIDEVTDALNDIANDGKRASSIIDHVRALVKKGERRRQRLNLNDLVHDVAKLVAPEIHRRGLTLSLQLTDNLPVTMGDAIELQQVILNLLINAAQAMKHTPAEQRQLIVRTHSSGPNVVIAVADSGHGVPDNQIDRLFEPFYTTKAEGTGMGLAINRTIVEAHGGEIAAVANTDAGMTFTVKLPACAESES